MGARMIGQFHEWIQSKNSVVMFYIGVLALGVSVFFPFFGSYFKADPRISIAFERSDKIYQKDGGFLDLKVVYKGVDVESLYRTYYRLKNNSEKSYKGKDVQGEQIYIEFSDVGDIISSEIIEKSPRDVIVSPRLDSVKKKIYLETDLMNPGDEVMLAITSKSIPQVVSTGGRVEGVREVVFDNISYKFKIDRFLPLPMSLIFISMGFFMLFQAKKIWKKREAYASMKDKILKDKGNFAVSYADGCRKYLEKNFKEIEIRDRDIILSFIDGLEDGFVSNRSSEFFMLKLEKTLFSWKFGWGSFSFLLFLCFLIILLGVLMALVYIEFVI